MENPNIVVGIKFKNAKVFRDAVVNRNVTRWFNIRWIKNENKKMLAKCRREGCNWRIYASLLHVKIFHSKHTYANKFEIKLDLIFFKI